MADQAIDAHRIMLKAMGMIFSPGDLERMTTRIETDFPGLDLKSLPEYQAAVDAMTKYRDAAVAHFDSEYQKQLSSE